MPTYRDRGFVLKMRPIRDADRHYTIFTEDHGKISVLAKGSRRGRSKMSPHLAAFGLVDLMIARGRVIDRLAGAGMTRAFDGVFSDLTAVSVAQSFLLTVDSLTKRELPEDRVFRLIHGLLDALDRPEPLRDGPTAGLIFSAAVIKLLDILGFAPELGYCIRCRRTPVGEVQAMNIARGGLECASCRGRDSLILTAGTLENLRSLRAAELSAVRALPVSDRSRRQIGLITELLLAGHADDRLAVLGYMKSVAAG